MTVCLVILLPKVPYMQCLHVYINVGLTTEPYIHTVYIRNSGWDFVGYTVTYVYIYDYGQPYMYTHHTYIYIDIHGPDQTYAYNDMLVNGAAEQLQRRTEDLEVMRYGF
jgi:hypothetical protein